MPKNKTHKSAAKRFKRTATGKVMRKQAYASHILTKKTTKRKRQLRKKMEISSADRSRVTRMLNGC
ncbi:MAG: 50S ribosomal protein L35 [Candidatus Sumerlaeota bacterium]|nr:50S ribosomal protein L35 [Candidatus Sumerlaeota bacterium]